MYGKMSENSKSLKSKSGTLKHQIGALNHQNGQNVNKPIEQTCPKK
jgi:hypothetical protein